MTTDPMGSSESTDPSTSGGEATTPAEASQPISEMAAQAPGGNGEKAGEERPFVGQLQHMIDNVAHVATPVLREVAAKAAELAAKAGEAAGPIAHKAADVTGEVGHRVAMKSREVAADLRRPSEGETSSEASTGEMPSSGDMPAAGGESTGEDQQGFGA